MVRVSSSRLSVLLALLVLSAAGGWHLIGARADAVSHGETGAVFALDLWTGGQWGQGLDETGMRSDLADMQQIGMTWATMYTFGEGHPDQTYLSTVNLADEYGIHILPIVDQNATADWMARIVLLLKDRIHFWQIGNEVDLPQDANDQNPDPKLYIAQLAALSQAIHQSDPTAKVMIGGLCECDSKRSPTYWLDGFVAAGGVQYIDLFSFHPYGVTFDLAVERLHMIQTQMAAVPALANMPLWLNEFGWQDGASGGCCRVLSETTRARTIVATVSQFRANGITTPLFMYVMHEPWQPSLGTFAFGLTNKDLKTMATIYSASYYALRDWQTSPGNTTNATTKPRAVPQPKVPLTRLTAFPDPVPILPIRKHAPA